jgi:hypothetical protein
MKRRWKAIFLGTAFGAVEAFAINKVSSDHAPSWWWLVVIAAAVGVAGCGAWAAFSGRRGSTAVDQRGGSGSGTTQQSVAGEGQNVSVRADNNSVAAQNIGTLNLGTLPTPLNDEDPPRR